MRSDSGEGPYPEGYRAEIRAEIDPELRDRINRLRPPHKRFEQTLEELLRSAVNQQEIRAIGTSQP